ncbi:uncharacterized protein LOC130999541 [Salvia miltiorrhiza]|uniref:uncharacterized protein LOC130999511 n=1 Tax=Salvia miltiorrhiza TaxID=226208 RepID=UPI0025ABB6A6|nr:uncharacterized protein LOC130999511 [Salvia miltiorrhiza]XP_057781076.1 uncharacterized protein LOC130999541 [Salvia miltiorrhiza]
MASDDKIADQINPNSPSSSTSNLSSSNPDHWKQRILIPTVLAGIAGGAVGLVSKHRKVHGLSAISATYASNFAIITGCYCGAREFVRASREGKPDDLLNSVFGGFGSGAILGRLQAGPVGAVRYSVMFAVVGTAVDYATSKIMPAIDELREKDDWLALPEWSPIKILDEEAVAAKRAREQQIYRDVHNMNKEKS